MIVVADTSPLNYLVLLGQVRLLPAMFRSVITPAEVIEELLHARAPQPVRAWAASPPSWLQVRRPGAPARIERLGPGEAAAIAIAEEVRGEGVPLRLLIDERDAIRAARDRGFVVIGTLAVLEEAAHRRLIDLGEAVECLLKTSFYVDEAVLADMWRRVQSKGGSA